MDASKVKSIQLYTYFRSSCSARLRIALALKELPYTAIPINLLGAAHKDPSYTVLNPSASVPTLRIEFQPSTSTQKGETTLIHQSIAALEYLDEAFRGTYQLLPPITDPNSRSVVRTLCQVISADVQPVTNMRILQRVKKMAKAAGKDEMEEATTWARELMFDGLTAYEKICERTAGRYSVGDAITMADCCLVPAVWGAERYGVDLGGMPTVRRVYEALSGEECVMVSHWKVQSDTPEELRH